MRNSLPNELFGATTLTKDNEALGLISQSLTKLENVKSKANLDSDEDDYMFDRAVENETEDHMPHDNKESLRTNQATLLNNQSF